MAIQVDSSSFELGFSKNLLNKIQSSKVNLDAFLQRQSSTLETIKAQNDHTYTLCQDKISAKMNELKLIQRQRGVMSKNLKSSSEEEEKDEFHSLIVTENDFDHHSSHNGDEEASDTSQGMAQKMKMLQMKQIALERKIANLTLEQKQVRNQVQNLRMEANHAFGKAEMKRKEKERVEKSKRITVEDLTIAILRYKQVAGLDFEKESKSSSPGAIRFIFTRVDKNDLDRKFTFVLRVNDEDRWEVKDCSPALDLDQVLALVEEFDETEDWPPFVGGMRSLFKDSLN